ERDYALGLLSVQSGIEKSLLQNELRAKVNTHEQRPPREPYERRQAQQAVPQSNVTPPRPKQTSLQAAYYNAERLLLAYMLRDRTIAETVMRTYKGLWNDEAHNEILLALYRYYEEGHAADVAAFIQHLTDERLINYCIMLSLLPLEQSASEAVLNDYIDQIRNYKLQETKVQLERELQLAEREGNFERSLEILQQLQQLRQKRTR
ncbi:MAG: hypothetical protein ACRC5C_09865, partial [Bacilli bacterium]